MNDSIDVVIADLGVWVAAHGLQVAILGSLLLASSAALLWSPRRALKRDNRRLRADNTFAMELAAASHARAAEYEAAFTVVEAEARLLHEQAAFTRIVRAERLRGGGV